MPLAPLTPCAHPGCPALVRRPTRYCEAHAHDAPEARVRREKLPDPFYATTAWQRFRKRFLMDHPSCYTCGRAAVLVHHVRPISGGGARLDPDNCRPMCAACHSRHHRGFGREATGGHRSRL